MSTQEELLVMKFRINGVIYFLLSSRSHLVVALEVEGSDQVSGLTSRGTLTLCDLAGSERISKTEAEGQRLVEAAAINKSLTALGQVQRHTKTSPSPSSGPTWGLVSELFELCLM